MKYLLIPLFFLALLLPHLDKKFGIDKTRNRENRELKSFPVLSATTFNQLPSEISGYIDDNFGFRKWLIETNAKLKYFLFNSAPNKNIIIGKDNYMFLNHSAGEGDLIFNDYTHRNILQENELEKIGKKYKIRNRTLAKMGINYYCGFYPNKHSIYQEKLPFRAKKCIIESPSKADQILSHLKANKILSVIDFRPNLKNLKSKYNLYVKGDTHWNEMGSFIAYQKLLKYINRDFPQVTVPTINDYTVHWVRDSQISTWKENKNEICVQSCYEDYLVGKDNTLYSPKGLLNLIGFNLTETRDSFPIFIKKYPAKVARTKEDKVGRDRKLETYYNSTVNNNLKVLVFRDSYSLNLIKFLNQNFKEITFIRGKYNLSKVKKYKPNIIIDCTVERHFT